VFFCLSLLVLQRYQVLGIIPSFAMLVTTQPHQQHVITPPLLLLLWQRYQAWH
jgi:hypothetical protein